MSRGVPKAKISPPATFHDLRRSWASLSVSSGMPLPIVARNLGHSTVKITERTYGASGTRLRPRADRGERAEVRRTWEASDAEGTR